MKVLIALDDSPYSEILLDSVRDRHWPKGTQFKLISVVEPPEEDVASVCGGEEGLCGRPALAKRNARITRLCMEARHAIESAVEGAIVHFEMRTGKPVREIVEAATDWPADRVLIGAHGHNACPRYLTGSVSRSVAQHAPCSVEIVRASGRTEIPTAPVCQS